MEKWEVLEESKPNYVYEKETEDKHSVLARFNLQHKNICFYCDGAVTWLYFNDLEFLYNKAKELFEGGK